MSKKISLSDYNNQQLWQEFAQRVNNPATAPDGWISLYFAKDNPQLYQEILAELKQANSLNSQ